MSTSQESNSVKKTARATIGRRIAAGAVLVVVLGIFFVLWAETRGWIDIGRLTGTEICGFKQATGLPCPGCGVTTSAMAFVKGRLFESFYIQPAGAVFCCVLVVTAVFALLIAAFGVDSAFLHQPVSLRMIKYIVIILIIILAGGWAVTLARAIVENGR